jgi:hypothetical protein
MEGRGEKSIGMHQWDLEERIRGGGEGESRVGDKREKSRRKGKNVGKRYRGRERERGRERVGDKSEKSRWKGKMGREKRYGEWREEKWGLGEKWEYSRKKGKWDG